jgi:O-Antigen ligase
LIVFIIVRPQEFEPALQRVPFLHLFALFAVIGWVIDVRLRRTQPMSTPALPWAVGFLLWGILTVAKVVPEQLISKILEFAVLFALYGTIAHGIQRFRTFQFVAGAMTLTCMFVTLVCFHQGLSDKECIAGIEKDNEMVGVSDGRPCELPDACRGPEAEPGLDYQCEKVGAFGTYSVEGRVRYRGDLNDPNEVALVIGAGAMSMLIAFMRRKRSPIGWLLGAAGVVIAISAIMMTESRGGQVAMLLVFFVYLIRRFGFWAIVPAALIALPIILFGGRDDENAALSTQERYEAWATGLAMFRASPIFGVGAGQFGGHHWLTAHNSFVLVLAETGLPGLILFVSIFYVSVKSLILGIISLNKVPGAQVAQVWGLALLASMAATIFSISTLSFTYKSVLWIFFGLIGAWTNCVRHHRPEFTARLTWKDLAIIVIACLAYVLVILPLFLRSKGEM